MLLRNPKNSEQTVETQLTEEEAIKICRALPNDFAKDLAQRFMFSTRPLSPAQWYWVFKLAEDNRRTPEKECVQLHSDLQAFISQVPLMQFRLELNTESEHKVFGKILLRTPEIASRGIAVFGAYKYCGAIIGDKFYPTKNAWPNLKAQILLFSVNPRAWMESYGKATGFCCVCGRELTNEESVAHGIGPICREKFGF